MRLPVFPPTEGLRVLCQPTEDPMVVEEKHRLVCAMKLLPKCPACPHSRFKLMFRGDQKEREQRLVLCPRWDDEAKALDKASPPDCYVRTQSSTCGF
jgi:hypothetical protein